MPKEITSELGGSYFMGGGLVQRMVSEGRGSRQTILLARGTRTIRMCSFDARSEGQSGNSPAVEIGDL